MTILQMKYFDSVARNRSITKASKELFISQPGISKALIELEKEYELKFFIRKNNELTMTEEGIYFWDKVRNILQQLDELTFEMNHYSKKKFSLTVGVTAMVGLSVFPKIFNEFHHRFPNIQINIVENTVLKIYELVQEKEINVGLIIREKNDKYFHDESINSRFVLSSNLVFCVGKKNKLSTNKKLRLDELQKIPLVLFKNNSYLTNKIKEFFRELKIEPNIELCTDQLNVTKNLLLDGEFGTFFIKKYIENEKNIISIELDPQIEMEVLLIWRKDSINNKALLDFLECVK